MEIILGIFTVLGGIAGFFYFIERSGKHNPLKSLLSRFKKSSHIPINAPSLSAFMKSHPRLVTLARVLVSHDLVVFVSGVSPVSPVR